MKPRNLFVIMAKDATTDANDNLLTIFKIIEKFTADLNVEGIKDEKFERDKSTVMLPSHFVIVSSWYLGEKFNIEKPLRLEIDVIDPEGQVLKGPRQEFNLDKQLEKLNMNMNLNSIPVTMSGDYGLKVSLFSGKSKLIDEVTNPFKVEINWK